MKDSIRALFSFSSNKTDNNGVFFFDKRLLVFSIYAKKKKIIQKVPSGFHRLNFAEGPSMAQ